MPPGRSPARWASAWPARVRATALPRPGSTARWASLAPSIVSPVGSAIQHFRAKVAQENLIKASKIPYAILRATQFFEFIGSIVESGAEDGGVRLSPALIQPVAADDVSAALADLAVGAPVNGTMEIGGPDRFPLDELARRYLAERDDAREVIADIHARYFGTELNDRSLIAGDGARRGPRRFFSWLGRATRA